MRQSDNTVELCIVLSTTHFPDNDSKPGAVFSPFCKSKPLLVILTFQPVLNRLVTLFKASRSSSPEANETNFDFEIVLSLPNCSTRFACI